MTRPDMVHRLEAESEVWDVVIIGGGATGLGAAIDAASRGYRTILFERGDFAAGTSSRSTKLVHGGVRYLRQGNVALVIEALRERGRFIQNAPHLVSDLPFIVPAYDWWEGPFYGAGLRLYELLAGRTGIGPSRRLSVEETLHRAPTLNPKDLRGGIIYHDAQFDDARAAIALARTAYDLGACVLNHFPVVGLEKDSGIISGVVVADAETGDRRSVRGKAVINATGVFCDSVRQMDDAGAEPVIRASQGVHLVLDRSFLPGDSAVLLPTTADKRVLFALPWLGRVIMGTTDTEVPGADPEPRPLRAEVEFLLEHTRRHLTLEVDESDVLCVFAGLRPLVRHTREEATASLTREHTIFLSDSGLITITGGKWTTYRSMAEDAVDKAAAVADLPDRPSMTRQIVLHGTGRGRREDSPDEVGVPDWLRTYGTDLNALQEMMRVDPSLAEPIHPKLPYVRAQVVWGVRHEMALTVEDVLSRRTRALILDARASAEAAPSVARLMAAEMDKDQQWVEREVDAYRLLAQSHILPYAIRD